MNSFSDIKKKYDSDDSYNSFSEINTAFNGEPQTSMLDNIANVASSAVDGVRELASGVEDFATNTVKSVGNWFDNSKQALSNYYDAANRGLADGTMINTGDGYIINPDKSDTPEAGELRNLGKQAYDTTIGHPAMYAAMTPYMPVPIKAAAGLATLPTLASDAVQAYDSNMQTADATGGSWFGAVGNTVKNLLIDPLVEPVEKWIENPASQVDAIRQGGLGAAYDNVLMPFEGARGAYHLGKAVTPKSAKAKVGNVIDNVKSQAYDSFKDISDNFKKGAETISNGDSFASIKQDFAPEPIQALNKFDETSSEWNADNPADMQRAVYDRLRSDGFFTDTEAAAITGNIAQESTFDKFAISNDGNNSVGLVQWTGPRLKDFEAFAAENNLDMYDWRTQVDFIKYEMQHKESAAFTAMRENPNATPEEMAVIVREKYERPDKAMANDANRMAKAREVYDGQTSPHNNTPSMAEGNYNRLITETPKEESYNPNTIDFSNENKIGAVEVGNEKANLSLFDKSFDQAETVNKADKNLNMFDETKVNSEKLNPYADIKPAELADKIKSKEIEPKFREYDAEKLAEYEKYSEKELFEKTRDNVIQLKEGVTDPLGNAVKVIYDESNKSAIDQIANYFMRGHSDGEISRKRAFATTLIKETASEPDLILKQANGRNAYVSYFKGIDNITHEVIVSLDKADNGKIISSHVAADGAGNRNKAIKKFISDTKKADAIVYVSYSIRNELEGGPSQYRRPPSSDRVSPLDTQLHPSSNLNIADAVEKVKPDDVQYFSDNPKSPYRYVEGEENLTSDKPVNRQEIFKAIDENFKSIRHGRIGRKGVLGFFNTKTDAVRVRNYGDFEAAAHELGHYLDKYFGFTTKEHQAELVKNVHRRFGGRYDKLDSTGLAKEGFAEFYRDYTTNRARAKADFPEFYDEFTSRLKAAPELNARVEKVSAVMHQWYRQNPHERIKGTVTFGEGTSPLKTAIKNPKETVTQFLDDAYTRAVDELHPLEKIVSEVEDITGKKLKFADNPFMQAWVSRGWVGKAEAFLEHGPGSFKEAIADIPDNLHKDFSAYLVAKRQMDILRWNKAHPNEAVYTDKSIKDVIATIEHYESTYGSKFIDAQQKIVSYSNKLLDLMRDEGLISRKDINAMRAKYPNYVPFIRDFGEAGIDNFGSKGGGFMNVHAPIKKMKGSGRDIVDPLESIIKNTYATINAIERNKVATAFVKISEVEGMSDIVERVTGTPTSKDFTFYVMKDGKKTIYQTTPDIYQALQFANAESSNWLVQMMKTPAGWLRAGATQLSPEFILRNPVRDMIGATIYSQHGFIPVVDTLKGMMHYLKKDNVYWDYKKSGAGNSAMVSLDRNYLQNSIRDILKKPNILKRIATSPLDIIRGLNEATEMATRLAEFDNATTGYTGIINRLTRGKKKPLSNAEAAIQARDVTLDFSRIGKNTKQANKMIAFFNASLQGTDKMVRAFKENPAEMTFKTAAFITLPSVALWWLNKDDPRYQELPQWEKDVFWIIPTEDTLIKIPKPFELGILFGTVPERALQYAYDKEKKVNGRGFEGLATTAMDNMMPSLMPTAAIPLLEWATNYSFFMQRNIVPQSMTKLPDRLQSDWRTSYIGNQVGNLLDVSPMKVDNTIRGYGGGFGSLIMDMTDRMSGVADTRPAKKWNEQPVIKGFTETPYKSSDSVQRLYDLYNNQDSLVNAMKLTGEKQEGFDAKVYNRTKRAYQTLQNLNKAAKKIRESKKLNSQQKRDKLDVIDLQKVNAARRGLGLQPISR
ncbi:phage tail tip lysozyme [Veillonella ratti]|uniref:phage tail tip lysozyme n=1 Tax=Veillonella ratti TaxID=103892 RepID=UPI000F8C9AA8|nr:phage tail tip lysozyme [Veillonella ratti]